jgi:hypothetical protein
MPALQCHWRQIQALPVGHKMIFACQLLRHFIILGVLLAKFFPSLASCQVSHPHGRHCRAVGVHVVSHAALLHRLGQNPAHSTVSEHPESCLIGQHRPLTRRAHIDVVIRMQLFELYLYSFANYPLNFTKLPLAPDMRATQLAVIISTTRCTTGNVR